MEKDKSDSILSSIFADYPSSHNEQYRAGGCPFFQQDLIPSPESSDLGSKGLSDSFGRVHFARSVLDLLEIPDDFEGDRRRASPLAGSTMTNCESSVKNWPKLDKSRGVYCASYFGRRPFVPPLTFNLLADLTRII